MQFPGVLQNHAAFLDHRLFRVFCIMSTLLPFISAVGTFLLVFIIIHSLHLVLEKEIQSTLILEAYLTPL